MTAETRSSYSMKSLIVTIVSLVVAILAFGVARVQGLVDPDLARRVVAIGFGAMLMVTGNALPRLVRPLRAHGNDPSRVMAAERFAGRTFVLAGIAFVALWVLAPIEHVMRISALVGLAAFGLVAASQVRLALGGGRRKAAAGGADTGEVAIKRLVLFYLLHGLLWVFAMFLADSIWGDRAAPWMVGGFGLANGALLFVHLTRDRSDE